MTVQAIKLMPLSHGTHRRTGMSIGIDIHALTPFLHANSKIFQRFLSNVLKANTH